MNQINQGKASGDVLGQPRGLWVLAGTELWDRISFHGMQAMLVLYMTGELLLAPARTEAVLGFATYRQVLESLTGPLTPTALAAQTFGFYMALTTGLPLLGGWIGDRFLPRRSMVATGAAAMTAGHLCMAFDATFLVALLLVPTGAGLLRGNLSAQVRSLYQSDDPRSINAFQYYGMSVSFGGFVAPIVTGAVAAVWGWHAGFGVAGIGMLIGLIIYLAGGRHLPPDPPRLARSQEPARARLSSEERRRVTALFLIWPISICFWIAQAQVWNIYNVWLRDHVDMNVAGFEVPVPWMQSLDGLAPTALALASLWVWGRMAKTGSEPAPLSKMIAGLIVFGLAVCLLALAPVIGGDEGKASLAVPILFHLISNLGWVWYSPVVTALYARAAPDQWRGTMLGINMLAISAASIITGRLGVLYDQLTPAEFWLLHGTICFGAGLILLVTSKGLDAMLESKEPTPV